MPAHNSGAGSIILEEAYALGKMVECSAWNGLLRDHITPSDIDLCFDNNGSVIFVDLSVSYDRWDIALAGQRRMYAAIIAGGPHCAVLAKHSVTPSLGRKIDSLHDIESFQAAVWDSGFVKSPVWSGSRWQEFVQAWVNTPDGPSRIRQRILSMGTRRSPSPPLQETHREDGERLLTVGAA